MSTLNIVLFVIAILLFSYIKISKMLYVNNDKNFKDGVKWPKWMVEEAEEWNKKHPDKKVKIRNGDN